MAPEKSPSFQFYPSDFLIDEHVLRMSYTERGVYITLLCECWIHRSLPADVGHLSAMLKLSPNRVTKLFEGPLGQCFRDGSDGRLYHKRLDLERDKQERFRRRQSDAAASRWQSHLNASVALPPHCPRVEDRREKKEDPEEEEPSTSKIGDDAARFLERYQELYREHRHGARLHVKPSLDWTRVCDLLQTWDFQRLEKLAVILLTTDDDWISRTDRGIGVFASRASWADDTLKAWEVKHGVIA